MTHEDRLWTAFMTHDWQAFQSNGGIVSQGDFGDTGGSFGIGDTAVRRLVEPGRIELPTSCVQGRRSPS